MTSVNPPASSSSVDVIYIAASTWDARYTRICVASVRYFYPDAPIRLLVGGQLQAGLAEELKRYWNVGLADLPPGDYGWGFVKLEALFGPPGERFLVLDSDTIMTGPVLDAWTGSDAPFLFDAEEQSVEDAHRLYYNWEQIRPMDPKARPPAFLFNSGQWFGTAGVLAREDFDEWLEWTLPRRLRYPKVFQNGDQGLLNYVVNQKHALEGLNVYRRTIMRWPGHSMQGLDADRVSDRLAEPLVVHWAGLKKPRLRDMAGDDLLRFFEQRYYARLRFGALRHQSARLGHFIDPWRRKLQMRFS